MFSTKLDVRYSETDQMGVVHHSRYFPWFEVARTEFFKSSGMSYDEVERRGVMFPLVDCYCKFIEGAKYGDTVEIEVEMEKLGVAKCQFSYCVIRCEDGKMLASGYTTHGFTDHNFRPLNVKKSYPEVYEMLYKLCGETN